MISPKAALLGVTALLGSMSAAAAPILPVLQLSGSGDFGSVLVGQSATLGLTATNTGGSGSKLNATFQGVTGEFSPNSAQPYSNIAAGQSKTATYIYAPVNLGADTTTVNVTGNGGSGAVTLTGNGVAPVQKTTVTGAGNVLVGSTGTASIAVDNTGNGNLSGKGAVSNLQGSVGAAAGTFTGAGGAVNLADGGKSTFNYQFVPTVRGLETKSVQASYSNGNAAGTNKSQSVGAMLTGTGVAAVGSVEVSDPQVTRLGTSMNGAVVVKNLGDGNLSGLGDVSNLKGSVGAASGAFAGAGGGVNLADNGEVPFFYAFTPVTRGTTTADVGYSFTNGKDDGSNTAFAGVATLTGTAVGPTFSSDIGPGGLDFGAIAVGTAKTLTFNLANITTDIGPQYLVGLTILDIAIEGFAKDYYTLEGFSAGSVLDPGASITLGIRFDAPGFALPSADALLRVFTDEGASFGSDGAQFVFSLDAASIYLGRGFDVPEPAAASLLVLGLGAMVLRRRRASASV